jgi:cell division protein FtsQ
LSSDAPQRRRHRADRQRTNGGRRARAFSGPRARSSSSQHAGIRANAAAALPRTHAARPAITAYVLIVALSKLLGLAILLGSSALLYDLASSVDFSVRHIAVAGNHLLTDDELRAAAGANGRNLFWIRRSELSQRLRQLPPVESADVVLEMPDRLRIEVKERDPVAVWQAVEIPFLVDRDGLVLAARPANRPLSVIVDTSNQSLLPGNKVNANVVRSVSTLDRMLSEVFGPQAREYQYSPDSGLNVVQTVGPRLVFGDGDDLEFKIAAVQTMVRDLEANQITAQLIDVRFDDRPYYR